MLNGTLFVIGIIAGIGPQNLYIISYAIKQENSLAISTTCCIADIILIILGCIGLSLFNSKLFILFINLVGIIFILWYLVNKVRGLFHHHTKAKIAMVAQTRFKAIIKALALTWLNPLVLIDTVVLVAGTANHYSSIWRIDFIFGAVLGDMLWIFGITYLAKTFSNKLNRVEVWIALDVLTILIMSFILYVTIGYLIS
ncbi:MAG: L-lysine exporter family protein LysE/ArgO [Pseudomonadota bacterium]|nr:L-lysine exporter family protein LysE/ArgO [Pseudomonadota bacterium]